MAILKSTTYTAQETAANNAGSYIDSAELISGKVSFLQCTYTAEAGTQAADYILLGYIPSGMTVIPSLSTVHVSAATATLSGDLYLGANDTVGTVIAPEVSLATVGVKEIATDAGAVGSVTTSARTPIAIQVSTTVTTGAVLVFNFFLVNSN